MAYQTFKIPCDAGPEVLELLNGFMRRQSVLAVTKEWVSAGAESFWAFCIQYQERKEAASQAAGEGNRPMGPKVDYKEVLTHDQFVVFSALRDVRKRLAEKEGTPVFAVFTNEQLAEMVRARAATLTDLKKIPGVGEARATKYGEAMLGELKRLPAANPPVENETGETSF